MEGWVFHNCVSKHLSIQKLGLIRRGNEYLDLVDLVDYDHTNTSFGYHKNYFNVIVLKGFGYDLSIFYSSIKSRNACDSYFCKADTQRVLNKDPLYCAEPSSMCTVES